MRYALLLCLLVGMLYTTGCGSDFRYHQCDANEDCGTDLRQRKLSCACDGVCRASCSEKVKCLPSEDCVQGLCVHREEPNVQLGQPCTQQQAGLGVCATGVYVCSRTGLTCQTTQHKQAEICDGLDNDCDGRIDEDLSKICTNSCGVGRQKCSNGKWTVCDAVDSRTCRSTAQNCKDGVEYCKEGSWTGTCEGEVVKSPEKCDNIDNDCNGQVDEGLQRPCKNVCGSGLQFCKNGTWGLCDAESLRLCGSGKGDCQQGYESCKNNHWTGICVGEVTGAPEICDDRDNNCDGKIDEPWPLKYRPCQRGIGECLRVDVYRCTPDKKNVECPAQAGPPSQETCDARDNDCDGQVDEGLERPCQNTCGLGKEVCASGQWLFCNATDSRLCDTGAGYCKPGSELCEKGAWTGLCKGSVRAGPERCDGIDNDCNGKIDENWPLKQPCYTPGVGSCKLEGKIVCKPDGSGAECSVKQPGQPKTEVCDGEDNDCDGIVDNVAPIILTGHTKTVYSVASHPGGSYIASGSGDGTIRIVTWSTKTLHKSLRHGNSVHSVAFSNNGSILASGSSDHTIKLWEVSTGRLLRTLSGHQGTVNSIRFERYGKVIASASDDKTIRLWEASTGKHLGTLTSHTQAVTGVAFGLYSKVLVSAGSDNKGKSWNLVKGNQSYDFWKYSVPPTSVDFDPFGMILAVGSSDNSIQTYTAIDLDVFSFRFAEMQHMASYNKHTGKVWSVDIYNGPSQFQYMVSGSSDRTVLVWNLANSSRPIRTRQGHTGNVRSVVFRTGAQEVISGSEDSTVYIWHCLGLQL